MTNPRKETAMSRIPTPATIDTAPAASRPMLEAGVVPEHVPSIHVATAKAISRLSRLNRDCR
jgi:hypothetical protein